MASQSTQSSSTGSTLKELTSNDLALLCNTLNPVASKCFALGLQMGVEYPQLCTIEYNYRNCGDQLREIISERLKQDSPLTWHDIVTALRSPSVNHPDLARQIESQYISPFLDFQQLSLSDPQQDNAESSHMTYTHTSAHHSMQVPAQYSSNPTAKTHTPLIPPASAINIGTGQPLHSQLPKQYPSQPPQPINTGMYAPFPSLTSFQSYPHYQTLLCHSQIQPHIPPQHTSLSTNPFPQWPHYPPPQPLHIPSSSIHQSVPSSDQSSSRSSSAVVASQSSLQCTQPGSVYPSSIVPSHTIPHLQSPTTQPGWGTYPPNMYPPHQIPLYHTGISQPCPNPPQLNPELPTMEGSSASHSARSAALMSPMDIFVHYVKVIYKQSEIEKNLNVLKWPPTPSKIFINLACIDWESVVSKEEADEVTRAMVEDGNVDVIMKKKTNIDFEDIVRDFPPVTVLEKVVLVEGAPGVGKSTFAWEFCRRWERGEIAQQYQLVLLLQLRDERMSRAKSLRDLIYHSSESVCQAVVEELESTFGVNTLIILEGFDELCDSQRKEFSIFLQLILGKLLLHATIMITSRPWATSALLVEFKHRIFLHLEILGFTEENLTKYVTSVFTVEGKKTASATDQSVGDPDEASEETKKTIDDVMAYISKYQQIKACMYIPLNAAIVVSIYRESMKSKWVLPKTLTELYQTLTQILLLRHLRGHAEFSHQKWSVESFEDLPGEVYSQFLVISKIAYDGICREGEKSVQLIFPNIADDFETLGLMQSVSQLFMDGQKTSHNFLHLTVQEFLAAFLTSTKSAAEQLNHFQRHKDGRLRVVLRFLAGLTKLNAVTSDQLRSLLGEPTVEQSDEQHTPYCNPMRPDVCVSAHHTNWLFEAQSSELLQSLFQNLTASFTFTSKMLSLEYYSVGYCIAHSHSKWLLIFAENPEEEKVSMLLKGADTGNIQQCRVATVRATTSMSSENLNLLLTSFSGCVEELYLRVTSPLSLPHLSALRILELNLDGRSEISNFSFSVLESLTVRGTAQDVINTNTKKALCKLLSSSSSIVHFRFQSTSKDNQTMNEILECLCNNTALPLKSLDIDCKCTFTTTAARSLAQFIARSTTLQYIRMCHVTFSAQGLIKLTEAIHHCSRLQEKKLEKLLLYVECSEDVVHLRHIFKDYSDMRNSIDWNEVTTINKDAQEINEINALTLSVALEYSCIEYLYLSGKSISDSGAVVLAQALHQNSTLEVLSLLNNSISDGGAVALAQALHRNSTLKWLHLSNNRISDGGAVAIAQALPHNSTLKWLHLSNNSISDDGPVALAQALHHNSTLEELDLSNNSISDDGAVALAQALHHNSTLEVLNLSNNSISDAGAVALAQGLNHNSTLKKMYWFNNSISNAGAVAIADVLHHNSTLNMLDLSYNSISDVGAVALAQSLHHNSTLNVLYLFNGSISDVGAVALAQALHHNSTLNMLYLFNNSISDTGAVAIAQSLHHNSTLHVLDLSNNSISDAGAVALAQALHHNSTLKELHLSDNDAIGKEGTHQLVQALTVNTSITKYDLRLPRRCMKYATQCPPYNTVTDRISFWW